MAGNWISLTNKPPTGITTMLLLTDGSVMCKGDDGTNPGGRGWVRLTPDASGSYANGAWSLAASMKNARRYFASAILADGRLVIAGGEYGDAGDDLAAAEVYDPQLDAWSSMPIPSGWSAIGDASSCLLADGRWLIGSIMTNATAIYDPRANSWSAGPNKEDRSSEETWTLLPDGSVLTVECFNHPRTEKYLPHENRWVTAGQVPVELVQDSSKEIGPAVLMPDGRVLAVGATGHTAIYTSTISPSAPGGWIAGPDLPKDTNGVQLVAKDAPACLLPAGQVLCVASPYAEGVDSKSYPGPSYFFLYDGATFATAGNPLNAGSPAFAGRLLLLPNGQVLFANGSDTVTLYDPDGTAQANWAPTIASNPAVITPGATHTISGMRFNGLSQAVSYGDDAAMATNYPLVRIRRPETNSVWYCRTSNHSTMAVATGDVMVHTNFTVPNGVPDGNAVLEVVANGIPSAPVQITVGPASVGPSGGGGSGTQGRGCALRAAALGLAVVVRLIAGTAHHLA